MIAVPFEVLGLWALFFVRLLPLAAASLSEVWGRTLRMEGSSGCPTDALLQALQSDHRRAEISAADQAMKEAMEKAQQDKEKAVELAGGVA